MSPYNCVDLHTNSVQLHQKCLLRYYSLASSGLHVEVIKKTLCSLLGIALENMCSEYCADREKFQGGDTL